MKAPFVSLLEKMWEENVQCGMTWVHYSQMSHAEAVKPYAFVFSQVLSLTLMFLYFQGNLIKINQDGNFKTI